jgi:polar amino acid transport system substrate-binding protein
MGLSGAALAQDVVRVGTEGDYPPFNFIDETGEVAGLERDMMDEICSREGLVCEWQVAKFDELMPGVASGRFDVIVAGISVTEERRALVDFTKSYVHDDSESWYLGWPDAPAPADALIAVQSGTVYEEHVRNAGYDYISLVSDNLVLQALLTARAELALGAFVITDDMGIILTANEIDYLYSETIPDDGIAMAVRRGNTELLDRLNAGFTAISADGTYEEIQSRWFK